MTGICLYAGGPRALRILPIALYGVSRVWKGPVFVALGGMGKEVGKTLDSAGVLNGVDAGWIEGGDKTDAWKRKIACHVDVYPFDINIYYDMDHVWTRYLDPEAFDELESAATTISRPGMTTGLARKAAVGMLTGGRLESVPHVNGGFLAVRAGGQAVENVARLMKDGASSGVYFYDEDVIGVGMTEGWVEEASVEWSAMLPRGRSGPVNGAMATHASRGRFKHMSEWRILAAETFENDFLGCASNPDIFGLDRVYMDTLLNENRIRSRLGGGVARVHRLR